MVVKSKISDRLKEQIRLKKYSAGTEKAYTRWYEKFILFHKVKHPTDMGERAKQLLLVISLFKLS